LFSAFKFESIPFTALEDNMATSEKDTNLQRCLSGIERQLGWGSPEQWTNYDFSRLSDAIHLRTQVRLSVSTLKRVWGRLKYDSAPTITTLNALAQFDGFADWREFCKEAPEVEGEPPISKTITPPAVSVTRARRSYFWLVVSIPLLVIAALLAARTGDRHVDPAGFQFRLDKIKADGVPNSVVFHYDASAAKTDSIFIVQTWDIRRKKLVSKHNHEHSAIYYYPGFFNTKLIVDGKMVKHQDLWITSNGWLGLAEQDPVPVYFKKEEYSFIDRVEIDETLLSQYNLPLLPVAPRIRFFNQRDLGDIMNDNFVFETTLRNGHSSGSSACQFVEVLIQCKNDIVIIPLADQSCVGDLELWFCGTGAVSANADLSGFGCDLHEWTTLRVETVNKRATIFVNNKEAYSLMFPNDPTGVVGVQYRFRGVGAVRDTWFEFDGKRIDL
jgi:hypothetical protein